ncbi:unnamed protein product [Euphydryas editha]|uniref:Transposase n=1 Tax=Euphydryas editha TaxID=104508 RepID=A0AAU9V971_EUPED|nr:unnamed protein product [Euphydryas editha]
MVASGFLAASCFRHVSTTMLENHKSINSEWYYYGTLALPKVFRVMRERRPKTGLQGIMLHYDNASSHTSLRTKAFLKESGVEILPHLPYSPNLVTCDVFLLPFIKEKIKEIFFSCAEEAVAEYEVAISELSDQGRKTGKSILIVRFRRMELCIENKGEYFEKYKINIDNILYPSYPIVFCHLSYIWRRSRHGYSTVQYLV